MTRDDIQREITAILDAHDAALSAIRHANERMQAGNRANQEAIVAHDAAIVSAIDANRAALRLLNRLLNEGGAP
jgi:hypothetical protein